MVSMDQLLQESDFISLHVHLTDDTRHMIGSAQFGEMKRGVSLINTSRGGLIDESALIDAMEAGTVYAAGLDLIDGEWLLDKFNHPLIAYSRRNPRLYITPHVGGTSPEALYMAIRHSLQKVVDFFRINPGK